jgi:hypothetical protein
MHIITLPCRFGIRRHGLSSSQRGRLKFVLGLKDLSGTLPDDNAWGHCVAYCDALHGAAL